MHKGRSTPRRTSWRIGHLFLAHVNKVSPKLTAKWGTDWVKIQGQYAADVEPYEHLTTYLTKTYIEEEPNAGPMQHPSSKVATQVWSQLIQNQKARFTKSTKTKTKVRRAHTSLAPDLVFSELTLCAGLLSVHEGRPDHRPAPLVVQAAPEHWDSFIENMYGSDKIDQTPPEIFLLHVVAWCEALSKANTPESAERKQVATGEQWLLPLFHSSSGAWLKPCSCLGIELGATNAHAGAKQSSGQGAPRDHARTQP